jgi:hypothetical protein
MRTAGIVTVILLASLLGWSQTAPDNSAGAPAQGQAQSGEQHFARRGPGVFGKITAIDSGKFTIQTREGQTAQVATSDQTQFRRDRQPAALADFKVGDMIFVRGEQKDGIWQAQMIGARTGGGPMGGEFREAMGKRFIVGEVKAINGTSVTILRPDGVTQNITVDESTSFRKDNQSITLADIKVGDHVFGRGALKNDVFVPAELNVGQPQMMMHPHGGEGNGSGAGPN